jgi:hypothetical protein
MIDQFSTFYPIMLVIIYLPAAFAAILLHTHCLAHDAPVTLFYRIEAT